MLKPYIIGGRLIQNLPTVDRIRARATAQLEPWPTPGRRMELSPRLEAVNRNPNQEPAPDADCL